MILFHPLIQYICENHFQRISNRSMFTGLKAINHFGRPDMIAFLKFVQNQHSYVSDVIVIFFKEKFTNFFPQKFIGEQSRCI